MSIYQGSTKVAGAINFGNKADIDSPALTGVPTAPTAATGTNTTQLATTAFVNAEIANNAPTKTGSGASGSWGISVTGNAATATKLATARTISLNTAATGTATSFDGNANITIPVTSVSESYLSWGGKNISGSYAPIDAAMVPVLGANRLAFIDPAAIIIEYSRDGGNTWVDYGASDAQKLSLFSGLSASLQVGGGGYAAGTDYTAYQLRVTINTANQVYTSLNKFVIYLSTNGSTDAWCTIDARTQANYTGNIDTWTAFASRAPVSGWSGFNVINTSSLVTYGNTAASQYGQVRFTFGQTGYNTAYTGMQIVKILGFGGVGWVTPSTMAATGLIYSYDYNKNVIFPANLQGTQFMSTVATGTSPIVVTSTTKVANLNVDKLDDQEGSYYLDWTNMTNKPDPVITLSGDATGSITLTNLASGTLAVTVVDDSHNHIISNVDGLQTALDAKASSTHTHGNITNAGAIGSTSGLAVVTTTSGVLTTGTVAIASGGTGATTAAAALTNLGITATATELNYTDGVTSNIQTQLSTKAPLASPALTGTPTAPTAAAGTSTTQVATTAFVENSAPFIISATAPTNTSKLWIDSSGIAYFYNGTAWVSIKGTYAD